MQSSSHDGNVEIITVSRDIPYALLKQEVKGKNSDILTELRKISEYYKVYREGAKFTTEGTSGDYVASNVRFKKAAQLINKEARFLFAEPPDITIEPNGEIKEITEQEKSNVTVAQAIVDSVLEENEFPRILMKAARDCLIGKRVGCVLNFNEETGITMTFLDAFNFVYELNPNNMRELTKFVAFVVVEDNSTLSNKRIFKKKYELIDGVVYAQDELYDGRGVLVEEVMPMQETKLTRIPAAVILNDGLLSDSKGESDLEKLIDFEAMFSKLNNADVDAERKSMNQIRYTVDMDDASTKNLSSSPGSYWDLQTNQNLDHPAPSVGTLSSSMEYSAALESTLKRLRSEMFEELEMPDITMDNLQGTITSGKALKAIYWPLIVRCKEKMKTWGPQLSYIIDVMLEGAMAYPNVAKRYSVNTLAELNAYVKVEQNFPLPEDAEEEKTMDLSEVAAQTMSKKSYMKKWRGLTDTQADEELAQIALERQMLEESYSGDMFGNMSLEDEEGQLEAEQELMKEQENEAKKQAKQQASFTQTEANQAQAEQTQQQQG